MRRKFSKIELTRKSTTKMSAIDSPKFLIFIKPWDDAVFLNLIKLLRFIEKSESELGVSLEIVMPEDLLIQVNAAKQKGMGDDLKEITTIFSE